MSDDLAEEPILKAIEDAIDGMEDMILYVDEYFRDKWGHRGYIDRAKAFRDHYLSTLTAPTPVTKEALLAVGFVEDDSYPMWLLWFKEKLAPLRAERRGEGWFLKLDGGAVWPEAENMADVDALLSRLSRPKPQ